MAVSTTLTLGVGTSCSSWILLCSRRAFDFKQNFRVLFAFESISIELILKYISSEEFY